MFGIVSINFASRALRTIHGPSKVLDPKLHLLSLCVIVHFYFGLLLQKLQHPLAKIVLQKCFFYYIFMNIDKDKDFFPL